MTILCPCILRRVTTVTRQATAPRKGSTAAKPIYAWPYRSIRLVDGSRRPPLVVVRLVRIEEGTALRIDDRSPVKS